MVALASPPPPPASGPGWLHPFLAVVPGLAVSGIAAVAMGERRLMLALAACVVLVAVMVFLGCHAAAVVAGDLQAEAKAVAAASSPRRRGRRLS